MEAQSKTTGPAAPATLAVGPVEARDLSGVTRLCEQLGYPSASKQVLTRIETLANDGDHRIFVARDDAGRVLGLIHVEARQGLVVDPFVQISALVVDDDHHGLGIGKLLMQEAERWARERGYPETTLYTNIVRTEAHRFYARLGYTTVKTSHVLHKIL